MQISYTKWDQYPYYFDDVEAQSQIRHRAARLLRYLLVLLEGDVPRLRWRYSGGRLLTYTPADHGEH